MTSSFFFKAKATSLHFYTFVYRLSNVMKVLFIDSNHPVLQEMLEANGIVCDLHYSSSYEEILKIIPDYQGVVIRSRFKITAEFIDKASGLLCIARAGAGMENIDVEYAEKRGIRCLHAPEGNRDAVGDQALGMLLCLSNNILRADREVRQGIWIREGNRGFELDGKTIGIIGYGNMGAAFAKRLRGFDVKVLVYDKYKKDFGDDFIIESDLDTLYAQCDIVSLHTPLTEETHYLINQSFLEKFKKPIILINTARGKCLNTAHLVEAMKVGKVTGACLDVLEYEKVSFEGLDTHALPEPWQYLIRSDKTVLTPHIAGWSHESNYKIGKFLAEKILTVLKPVQ